MIKSKYMFSEAKANAKDLAPKAKAKAKDMTSCARSQGHGLKDSISGENHSTQPVKATMIDIINDTDNIGPSVLGHNHRSQVHSTCYKHLMQATWTQVYYCNMYCI